MIPFLVLVLPTKPVERSGNKSILSSISEEAAVLMNSLFAPPRGVKALGPAQGLAVSLRL
ncbi:hypothetical protein L873DRAFT_1798858 [Choiromyces venosus 120613-1]|uniref:Uncharacterized protein n=1 Tax=Choiromyces venosus 120613-1 TaxID=1336337 RepID=A0A3N4K4V8_9PEZI|nr:hypothetical protein L873DRAFT_1798858 [Choiromyces venosus 120613-1]